MDYEKILTANLIGTRGEEVEGVSRCINEFGKRIAAESTVKGEGECDN